MGREKRFELELNNKLKVDPRHSAYYMLTWIACVDNYCNMHHILKTKNGKYPRKTKQDKDKTKF